MNLDRMPRTLLRVEGAVAFATAIAVYVDRDYSILALALLFLVPDVSCLGFLAGPRVGSAVYNAVHTYAWPLAIAGIGVVVDAHVPIELALIWVAHIGVDRALGYGLKYPTAFKDTHLQRL